MENTESARRRENGSAMVRVLGAALALAFAAPGYPHGDGKLAAKPMRVISTEETAFGREGDPKKVSRTVRIDMSDRMRFTPASLTVMQGETVKFVVKNSGRTMHEMVLGTMEQLRKHAELMRKYPAMEHDEPYMAHVAPGKTQTMAWQFTKAGEFHFGCLVPGHFEAGMVGRIHVLTKGAQK